MSYNKSPLGSQIKAYHEIIIYINFHWSFQELWQYDKEAALSAEDDDDDEEERMPAILRVQRGYLGRFTTLAYAGKKATHRNL